MGIDSDWSALDGLQSNETRTILRALRAAEQSAREQTEAIAELVQRVDGLVTDVAALKVQMTEATPTIKTMRDHLTFARVSYWLLHKTATIVGAVAIAVAALWGAYVAFGNGSAPTDIGPGPVP